MKLRYRLILIVVGLFLFVQVVNADITYNPSTNTIIITGTNSGNPWTFEDIYNEDVANGWGVFTKVCDNVYRSTALIQIGDGTTETKFEDKKVLVIFDISKPSSYTEYDIIKVKENADVVLGEIGGYYDYPVFIFRTGTNPYPENIDSDGYIELNAFAVGGNGRIDIQKSVSLTKSYISGMCINVNQTSEFAIVNFIDTKGDTFSNSISKSTLLALHANLKNKTLTFKNLFLFSDNYLLDIVHWSTGGIIELINCHFDKYDIKWNEKGYSGGEVQEIIETTFKIFDINGNPLPNRIIKVYDKNENLLTSGTTDINGLVTLKILKAKFVNPTSTAGLYYYTIDDWEFYNPFTIEIWNGAELEYKGRIFNLSANNQYIEIIINPSSKTIDDEIKKHDKEIQEFKNNYIYILAISIFIFLISKFTRTSFIALVAGIWLLILAVYTFQYGTPAFKDYSTIFAAIPLVLGVYMVIDGALGIIYD